MPYVSDSHLLNERRSHARKRALVVDGDVLSRIEMRLLLEMSGYQVDEVSDGMEAIGLLDMAAPGLDLVVLDYLMPQLNGLETYEALRALRPGLGAIICVSGIEDVRAGAIPTTVTFLKKPCTMHTLSDALERVHGLVRHSLSHGKAAGSHWVKLPGHLPHYPPR
jgi:CheY-like chemotaxis protein